MEDAFLKYMCRRVEKKAKPDPQQADGGPVITISRQYGCHGQSIGIKLVEAINRRNQVNNRHGVWQFISKEILYESAKELNMSPAALYELTTNVRDDIFSNLTTFFADNYYTDSTRRCNTIARILYSYAQAGNVVILGRAGESVTKNMKRSLSIKLEAPIEIRARRVSDEENISFDAARRMCLDEDAKRLAFRQYFEGKSPDVDFFDAVLNLGKLTDDEAMEVIMILAEARGFF